MNLQNFITQNKSASKIYSGKIPKRWAFPQFQLLSSISKLYVSGCQITLDFTSDDQLYTRDASKGWKPVVADGKSRFTLKEPSANVVLHDYIISEKWHDIVDFDDHLDDISKYEFFLSVLVLLMCTIVVEILLMAFLFAGTG